MPDQLPLLDLSAVRRAFDAAAAGYDEHAVLQHEVANRLLSRIDYLDIAPSVVLDIGAGTGMPTGELLARFPKSTVLALDLSTAMLKKTRKRGSWRRRPAVVCADTHSLPLEDESVDMIFSSLSLQWCDRPEMAFAEIRRILKPDGVLLFTTFGPDTLRELRTSWQAVDGRYHVHDFLDMHDIGDMMVYAGLQEPVMEREVITLTYDSVRGVMDDLKYIGASNAVKNRGKGLLGKGKYQKLNEEYSTWCDPDGRYPASYEVVYGTAWSASTRQEGMVEIALDQIGKRPGAR